MEKIMIAAEKVTPGMEIAFDIMGNTVCITPNEVKVVGWTCEFRSETTHSIVVEPCTMVELLSSPIPEPLTAGSRVLVDGRAFLRVSSDPQKIMPWLDVENGNRYHWAALRDLFGAVTVLDDNPGWTVGSSKSETETVESLDDADPGDIYKDSDGDLWMQDPSRKNAWVCYMRDPIVVFNGEISKTLTRVAHK